MHNSEEEDQSNGSSRSSRSSESKTLKTSKEWKCLKRSKASKKKEPESKIWVAKLVAEEELIEQKKKIESKAQNLQIREELAKARASVSAYDEVKPVNLEEVIMHKMMQWHHDCRYYRPDYDNTIPWKEKNYISTWNSNAVTGHLKDELWQRNGSIRSLWTQKYCCILFLRIYSGDFLKIVLHNKMEKEVVQSDK